MNKHSHRKEDSQSLLGQLWSSFWNGPDAACPKCGNYVIEYYDPFFFAPIRTLQGRRRIKCTSCHFIWRPSKRSRSFWDKFRRI